MSIQLTQEQSRDLPAALPVAVTNTDGAVFYLLSADQFQRVQPLLEVEVDVRALYPHMAKVFGEAGWDDPEMDLYNELDPRRNS